MLACNTKPANDLMVALLACMVIAIASSCDGVQGLSAEYRTGGPPTVPALLDRAGVVAGDPVFIRLFKQESELELWMQSGENASYRLLKTYPVCAWSGSLGPKLREGDNQAPEGFYSVSRSALNPNSSYHLSFNIGFPNQYDRAHGRTGSYLMVHGDCVSIGCYAMTDAAIEEIYHLIERALINGQENVPVHIFPFRMSEGNLHKNRSSDWSAFWRNLKTGYDAFERKKTPPVMAVDNKRYVVLADG